MKRYLFVSFLGFLALAWLTLPRIGEVNFQDCSPYGIVARLSATIYDGKFWNVQLEGIRGSRVDAETWDRKQATAKAMGEDVLRQAQARLAAIYEEYPSLAPTSAEVASRQFRERADEIDEEQARRMVSDFTRKQVPILKHCEDVIVAHLTRVHDPH